MKVSTPQPHLAPPQQMKKKTLYFENHNWVHCKNIKIAAHYLKILNSP